MKQTVEQKRIKEVGKGRMHSKNGRKVADMALFFGGQGK